MFTSGAWMHVRACMCLRPRNVRGRANMRNNDVHTLLLQACRTGGRVAAGVRVSESVRAKALIAVAQDEARRRRRQRDCDDDDGDAASSAAKQTLPCLALPCQSHCLCACVHVGMCAGIPVICSRTHSIIFPCFFLSSIPLPFSAPRSMIAGRRCSLRRFPSSPAKTFACPASTAAAAGVS